MAEKQQERPKIRRWRFCVAPMMDGDQPAEIDSVHNKLDEA